MEDEKQHAILVVEDDALIRESIKDAVEMEGFDVHTAVHGGDALQLLNEGLRPCVILLDLMMPVMNGWELLELLSARTQLASIPVVVLTAASENVLKGLKVKDLIRKPLELDNLLARINAYCPHRQMTLN